MRLERMSCGRSPQLTVRGLAASVIENDITGPVLELHQSFIISMAAARRLRLCSSYLLLF